MNLLSDGEVIDRFVEHLSTQGYPDLKVESCPDELNRDTPDIDAVAGLFAIEHTQVESVENQHRDGHFFTQVTGDLEDEFRGKLSFHLAVLLDYDAVKVGQNWQEINRALRKWLNLQANQLPEGRSIVEDVDGIPFRLIVWKDFKLGPGLGFGRTRPDENDLDGRFLKSVERKASKLKPYQESGKTTILLIENNDIALMNHAKMFEAFERAYPKSLPDGVDQIWFAHVLNPDLINFWDFSDHVLA